MAMPEVRLRDPSDGVGGDTHLPGEQTYGCVEGDQGLMYEYGIVTDTSPTELHRGPMSQDEAEEWMGDLKERHRSMFRIVRREVSTWRPVD